MYAIFKALGKQFRAEKGKTLRLPLLHRRPGPNVHFPRCPLAAALDPTPGGAPFARGARAQTIGRYRLTRLGRAADPRTPRTRVLPAKSGSKLPALMLDLNVQVFSKHRNSDVFEGA